MNSELTFDKAITLSNDLIQAVESGVLTEKEASIQLASIIASTNGARGFFVALLTGTSSLSENIPQSFIEVFKEQPEIICDLLTKNLVMSATMVVTHNRNGDEAMAANSRAVNVKTKQIIKRLNTDVMAEHLNAMEDAVAHSLKSDIDPSPSRYAPFLVRWRYDAEQLQLAQKSLSEENALTSS